MRSFIFAAAIMLGCASSALASEKETKTPVKATKVAAVTINTTTFTEPSVGEFPTLFTRLGANAKTYEEYMDLYPLIVDELEFKYQILAKENPNFMNMTSLNAPTCAYTSSSGY